MRVLAVADHTAHAHVDIFKQLHERTRVRLAGVQGIAECCYVVVKVVGVPGGRWEQLQVGRKDGEGHVGSNSDDGRNMANHGVCL